MANQEYLNLLQEGVEVWNNWRLSNVANSIDLSEASLAGAKLGRADLCWAKLNGAILTSSDLIGAKLSGAKLIGADLGGANLSGADLSGADLIGADLCGANLSGADLIGADLIGAKLIGAKLIGADLSGAYLSGANLNRSDFRRSYLSGADLSGADLGSACLSQSNLSGADLSRAVLIEANLSGAYLRRACLSGGDLNCAELIGADLTGANLTGADLCGADLSGASLKEANLSRATVFRTVFGNVDLSEVKGLRSVKHLGPSTVGIDTFFRSKGRIPKVFLRGAGVPDIFIQHSLEMAGDSLESHAAFISYSPKDEEFAQRIYADLQAQGVRCWYARADLNVASKCLDKYNEVVRNYEGTLLVLSEHSIASSWVEKEVETALEREREEKRTMLFPIRLDGAVIESNAGWAADIRRSRSISDFSHWQDHDAYQKALAGLLREIMTSRALTP